MPRAQSLEDLKELQALMGLCLSVLHEVEFYLTNAFFLGLSERDRKKYKSLRAWLDARGRMTFGQLVGRVDEEWDIEPNFKQLLDKFVEHRNRFVHGLTIEPGIGFHRKRDCKRLREILVAFFDEAMFMRQVFRGAFLLAIELGIKLIPLEAPEFVTAPNDLDKEHIAMFTSLFALHRI